jgi:hypothetical protein
MILPVIADIDALIEEYSPRFAYWAFNGPLFGDCVKSQLAGLRRRSARLSKVACSPLDRVADRKRQYGDAVHAAGSWAEWHTPSGGDRPPPPIGC